jgi:hypothetical protein
MDIVVIDLAPPHIGDVTHDGFVDIDDLLVIITGWGPCPPPTICPSDASGDGTTDIDDLLLAITNWG